MRFGFLPLGALITTELESRERPCFLIASDANVMLIMLCLIKNTGLPNIVAWSLNRTLLLLNQHLWVLRLMLPIIATLLALFQMVVTIPSGIVASTVKTIGAYVDSLF